MKPSARQSGFSLIELLIAITLGLVLTAGLISVFVSSKQGYRVQESRGRMQENVRFSMEYLSQAVRLADFFGSAQPATVTVLGTPSYTGAGGCENGWLINPNEGLRGYGGGTTYPGDGLPSDCLNSSTVAYIPSSDVLAVRYADPSAGFTEATFTANLADATAKTSMLTNGKYFLRVLAGARGVIFDADADSGTGITALPDPGSAPGALLNYRFKSEVFYLGNFTPTGASVATPTLHCKCTTVNGVTARQLVEGVEMMKFDYGIDSNDDKLVDRYLSATDTQTASRWPNVLSVRIGLVVRGDERDGFTDTDSYALPSGFSYTPATAISRFQRFAVVREVQVRNRVTSR